MKAYKIQHRDTGEFSTGGVEPTWNKTGKIWRTIGHTKSAVTNTAQHYAHMALRCTSPEMAKAFFEKLQDMERWIIIEFNLEPIRNHLVEPADGLSDDVIKYLEDKGFEMT